MRPGVKTPCLIFKGLGVNAGYLAGFLGLWYRAGTVLICDHDKALIEGAFPILFDPLLGANFMRQDGACVGYCGGKKNFTS
jgi:hypothetical protein